MSERSPIQLMNEIRRGRWWEDLRMASIAVGVGASTPSWDGANLGWIFAAAPPNNHQMQFISQMPHTYALGEDVEIHIHWALVSHCL